jgi:hypothetical protein
MRLPPPSRDRNGLRRLRLALTVGIVAALFAGTFSGAYAHHDGTQLWGSNYAHICDRTHLSQCVADGTVHSYRISTALSAWGAATRRGFGLWGSNTIISAIEGTGTDVYVTAANRPDLDYFAWTQCAPSPEPVTWGGSEAAHTRWCRPQWIVWNSWPTASSKLNTTAKVNYVGCHESGHTLGLRHRGLGTNTCMAPAPGPPSEASTVVPSVQNPAQSDYDRIENHY